MGYARLKKVLKPLPSKFRQLRSHDPNDHWLIQEIDFEDKGYEASTHVVIGCPQHMGVQRNNGRIGAAEAPNKIREQLYKLQVSPDSGVKLFDAGNVITDRFDSEDSEFSELMTDLPEDGLRQIHQALTLCVAEFLRDGKKVIVLGGGNDISYADVRALSEYEREFSAINIDAHLDMRKAKRMTSGTPYRMLIEDQCLRPQDFYEFGIRPESNAAFYLNDAREKGVHLYYLRDILKQGVQSSFEQVLGKIGDRPFFLGLDMDSVQAADAPGVSASSPVGLSSREVLECIRQARAKKNMRIFEITEVNPRYDSDNRTVKLAAQCIYRFLYP